MFSVASGQRLWENCKRGERVVLEVSLKFFFNSFIYFWLHWVFVAVHRLAVVVERRSSSLVVVLGLLSAMASRSLRFQ